MRRDVRHSRRWRYVVKPRILARDGFTCWNCGGRATTVDHIVPRAAGGSDRPDNLRASCVRCNLIREKPGQAARRHTVRREWPGALG